MDKFIEDFQRKYALNGIKSHIKRGDSVLIVGDYGTGKTELLKQIKVAGAVVRIYRPRGTVDQILKKISNPKAKASDSKSRDRVDLEEDLCKKPRTIIIDEAGDMTKSVLPSLKAIMDSGSSIILAAKPDFLTYLKKNHADILSRLTVIRLTILSKTDMRPLAPDFDDDAFIALHTECGNMRSMDTVMKNCREYAAEKGEKIINTEIVSMFIDAIEFGE